MENCKVGMRVVTMLYIGQSTDIDVGGLLFSGILIASFVLKRQTGKYQTAE